MKRPAFQFYPADWRKDVELRSCSVAARGLWIDVMCIAHECEPYGHLTVNGKPMNAGQLAGQIGLTKQQCAALLDELIENGVARQTPEGGIYSKRMVEDEDLRSRRAAGGSAGAEHGIKGAEAGKKGGRPAKARGVIYPPLAAPLEPPPSSSSSPSGIETPKAPAPPSASLHRFPPGFEALWSAYPRKVGKDAAAKAFAKRRPDAALLAAMVAAVEAQRSSPQWAKDGGQFIPHLSTWLNEGRWQDEGDAAPDDIFAGAR